jgi:hypothetical protein
MRSSRWAGGRLASTPQQRATAMIKLTTPAHRGAPRGHLAMVGKGIV